MKQVLRNLKSIGVLALMLVLTSVGLNAQNRTVTLSGTGIGFDGNYIESAVEFGGKPQFVLEGVNEPAGAVIRWNESSTASASPVWELFYGSGAWAYNAENTDLVPQSNWESTSISSETQFSGDGTEAVALKTVVISGSIWNSSGFDGDYSESTDKFGGKSQFILETGAAAGAVIRWNEGSTGNSGKPAWELFLGTGAWAYNEAPTDLVPQTGWKGHLNIDVATTFSGTGTMVTPNYVIISGSTFEGGAFNGDYEEHIPYFNKLSYVFDSEYGDILISWNGNRAAGAAWEVSLGGVCYFYNTSSTELVPQSGWEFESGISTETPTAVFSGNGTIDNTPTKLANVVSTEVVIYPNPTVEYTNVNVQEEGQLMIYNLAGKAIKTIEIVAGQNRIDMTSYASGVYLFSVKTGGDAVITKVVKK